MGFWRFLAKSLFGKPLLKWKEPAFVDLRVRNDWGPRLIAVGTALFGCAILLFEFSLTKGMKDAVTPAIVIGAGFSLLFGFCVFSAGDRNVGEVTLTDRGFKHQWMGSRYVSLTFEWIEWRYEEIDRAVIFLRESTGRGIDVLLLYSGSGMHFVGVPARVDCQKLAEVLGNRGVILETGNSLPSRLSPDLPLLDRANWPRMFLAAIPSAVGIVLAVLASGGWLPEAKPGNAGQNAPQVAADPAPAGGPEGVFPANAGNPFPAGPPVLPGMPRAVAPQKDVLPPIAPPPDPTPVPLERPHRGWGGPPGHVPGGFHMPPGGMPGAGPSARMPPMSGAPGAAGTPTAVPMSVAPKANQEETTSSPRPTAQPVNVEFRAWTDVSGQFRIEAQLVEQGDGMVSLRKRDGTIKRVPMDRLSEADRQYTESSTIEVQLAGGRPGEGFEFRAVDCKGRMLLGASYTLGEWDGEKSIGSLTGCYDRKAFVGTAQTVLAKEDYAVGAMKVDADRFVYAIQIVFMRIGPEGRLAPSDAYLSPWIGYRSGRTARLLTGKGLPIQGIFGRRGAILNAVGLVYAEPPGQSPPQKNK